MLPKRIFTLAFLGLLAIVPLALRADNTTPALQAFAAAFEKVNDYTCDLRTHEALGSDTQDRVYHYLFLRPSHVKTIITSGSGFGVVGSVGVWDGGETVIGHQGGILSMIHLSKDLHDHLTTSLRGYTIPDGLIQNIVAAYRTTAGDITQSDGGKIGGVDTDLVELQVAKPGDNAGVTKMDIYFSQITHLPIRNTWYQGTQVVRDQWFDNLKTNTGLKESDFGA